MVLKDLYLTLWGPKFLTSIDLSERLGLYRATLSYCFRTLGANAFSAHLVRVNAKFDNSYTNTQLRHWVRDNILYNGYVMRNVKFFMFALATRGDKTVEECAKRFGVHDADTCLSYLVTPELKQYSLDVKRKSEGIKFYCLDSYNKLLERVWLDNQSWVARMCWRKLRFIANSTGVDVDDLQNEVMTEALRAVNHTWPNLPCELYAHNLFKRTAHNVAMNMIERSMSQKHARLVKDGNGWKQLNVDYEGLSNNPEGLDDLSLDTREAVDLKVDVNIFISNLTRKKQKFLESLTGTQIELCQWLLSRNLITENEDNEDYLKSKGLTHYLKAVADWLEIQHSQAKAFLNHIRSYFTPYYAS